MTNRAKPGDESPEPIRVIHLKPMSYQPSKAELEEPVTFPEGTTPEDLAQAVVQPVRIVYEDE